MNKFVTLSADAIAVVSANIDAGVACKYESTGVRSKILSVGF